MKKITSATFVLFLVASAPANAAGNCVGLTKASLGTQPFSFVMAADGSVDTMTLQEAAAVVALLNDRHNNWQGAVEPVEARIFLCS